MSRIEWLHDAIRSMNRTPPQTPARELEIARMESELRVLKAERELAVAKRAHLLLSAYIENGSMVAILPSGQRIEPYLPSGVGAVQHIWNVKHEARNIASRSLP